MTGIQRRNWRRRRASVCARVGSTGTTATGTYGSRPMAIGEDASPVSLELSTALLRAGAGRQRLAPAEDRRKAKPPDRHQDEQIRQPLTISPVRAVGLGRPMQRFAVRKDVGLGELVEAVDQELDDEDEQEHGGDL